MLPHSKPLHHSTAQHSTLYLPYLTLLHQSNHAAITFCAQPRPARSHGAGNPTLAAEISQASPIRPPFSPTPFSHVHCNYNSSLKSNCNSLVTQFILRTLFWT
ncbi:Telomeric DNA-binding factor trf1 [Fusarium oxysporum f. sp. albedinis]|nr:Telomeric DNA-binding factor trf1 [Fusarium oxysporum f. sp. albedinis]